MKILILILLTLHLVNGAAEGELKYGDIISVSRTCGCFGFTYKHYGIYLDKKRFDDQGENENIFHFTGSSEKAPISACVFGRINIHDFKKDNYLDKIERYGNKVSTEEITKRINEKYQRCGEFLSGIRTLELWEAFSNNCEHLATYIRYGEKLSLQLGQKATVLVRNTEKTNDEIRQIKQQLKILEVPCDETCKAEGTRIMNDDSCDMCATNIG